jgi:ubiquinone/menaquinone biosynthesis C-methylase UbiE
MAQALLKEDDQSDFVKFWNEVLATKFNKYQNILMDGLSYHSHIPLSELHLEPGSRALDVGCGWGDTAIELAEKTGDKGEVVGMDCVDIFMEYGRQEAKSRGINNLSFQTEDVEIYPFQGDFDFVFSRFGMMFFSNPVFALRNIRKALKPGGKIMFIVWRTIDDNPWFGVPKQTLLNFLPPPGDGGLTCGPGPFSMAGQEMVTKQLHAAGFESVSHQRTDGKVMVGTDVDQAIGFQLAIGPAGEIYREAGDLATEKDDEIRAALSRELSPFQTEKGIMMDSSSWAITATNPK